MKKTILKMITILTVTILLLTSIPIFAIDGVYHSPYGIDDLYNDELHKIEAQERYPRNPIAGENVYIKMNTWPIEYGQAVWLTWTKNGISQPDIGASWKYNEKNDSYWEANMGSFDKGDIINYTVHANKDGTNQKTIGPFEFTVTDWEYVTDVTGYTDYNNHIVINTTSNTGNFSPKINLAFTADDVLRVQMSPCGDVTATGLNNYTVTDLTNCIEINTTKLKLKIQKNPYRLSVYKPDGTLISQQYDNNINRNMAWLTDGNNIIAKVEDHYYTPGNEEFYGFGEHYNNFAKRGHDIDTYVYNQYKNQNDRTYMAIPFFVSTKGYGIYLNSTYYSKFRMATEHDDMYSFTADTGGLTDSILDYYFIYGNDVKDVIVNYTDITGKPALPPKWAFGLWMSANEWNNQSRVNDVINNVNNNNIPATAIVLEQWSDEATFYIFNKADYTPKSGSDTFNYNDFTFNTEWWPNPKALVDTIHDNGMKVLLWQIPVEKYLKDNEYNIQKDNDESYMIQQGYAVGDGYGEQYRIPWEKWFPNSLLLDFTNPDAVDWWMSKREYLFDEVGIDGFKTDGGEMIWGRERTFSNGKKGDEMRNQYPNDYIGKYYNYSRTKKSDAVTFSRAGTAGIQKFGVFWGGDQASTFDSYRQAVLAGITANISGVPFWGWDLAGFTHPFPTSELYKRSTQMAAFCPIMQFHSENNKSNIKDERSPWNVAEKTGDSSVINTFTKFVNIRMNLLPYIYSEAKKTSTTGIPLMRAMVIEYPDDINTYNLTQQYMFGDNILVAPIVNEGETNKSIYLPKDEWIDLWWSALRSGNQTINYYAGVDDMPVFVKAGSIIPMNLNNQYKLGGTIGNNINNYTNLTFRIYPYETTSYEWYDDSNEQVKTITCTEEYNLNKITISLPPVDVTSTLQVFATKPTAVKIGTTSLNECFALNDLINAEEGYYYDKKQKLIYVKISPATSTANVIFEGVNKAEYEAEFATYYNVATNTNHAGYIGPSFVDQFEKQGDYVEFDVATKSAGTYDITFRYSAGAGNASRAIYINGAKITDISMPQTANWDTWNTVSTSLTLNKGHNKVKISFDNTNTKAINLDNIVLEQ